jgi:DNA-3-methyladenine glycosylase
MKEIPAARISIEKLSRAFYQRPAVDLAPDLLGKILVHRRRGRMLRARIVEAEAYVGTHDLACHASKGRTRRTEIMFGPAGHAYVYLIYGMYPMFNIVASVEGDAQAVLIRAAETLGNWNADLSGPGKLTRAFGITCSQNGLDLTGRELFLLNDCDYQPEIAVTKRIGVDYAGDWTHALLRFIDQKSSAVSKVRASATSDLVAPLIKPRPSPPPHRAHR